MARERACQALKRRVFRRDFGTKLPWLVCCQGGRHMWSTVRCDRRPARLLDRTSQPSSCRPGTRTCGGRGPSSESEATAKHSAPGCRPARGPGVARASPDGRRWRVDRAWPDGLVTCLAMAGFDMPVPGFAETRDPAVGKRCPPFCAPLTARGLGHGCDSHAPVAIELKLLREQNVTATQRSTNVRRKAAGSFR